jgi:periplasmic copper chaperone A
VLAAAAVSGCAAGRDAQTAYQRPTLDGTQVKIGDISLNAVTIQPPTATFYPAGSSAPMRLVLVNSGGSADTLTGITSPSFTGWSVSSAGKPASGTSISPSSGASSVPAGTQRIEVPANARVPFGTPEATATLSLTKLRKPAYPGSAVPITFTFAKAGAVTLQVPVGLTNAPNDSVIPSAGGGE